MWGVGQVADSLWSGDWWAAPVNWTFFEILRFFWHYSRFGVFLSKNCMQVNFIIISIHISSFKKVLPACDNWQKISFTNWKSFFLDIFGPLLKYLWKFSSNLITWIQFLVQIQTNKSEVCRFYLYWRIIRSIDFFEANFLS